MANALEDLFAGRPMMETEGAMFRPPSSTWADPKRAGGFGWGQLVHALGLLFRVADLTPKEVFAISGKSPAAVDYYDSAIVRFAGSASAVLSGAATLPKGRPVRSTSASSARKACCSSTSSASGWSSAAAMAETRLFL